MRSKYFEFFIFIFPTNVLVNAAPCLANRVGATQSNHARQPVAFAARMGIKSHILLENRTGIDDIYYRQNGNVLLDQLHGTTIEEHPADTDMDAAMETAANRLRSEGLKPYTIPGGGSNPVGAIGNVECLNAVSYTHLKLTTNRDV